MNADNAEQWQLLEDRKFRMSLVQQRLLAGLTVEDLSKAMKYSTDAILELEDDTRDTRLSTIRRYAAAVGAVYNHRVGVLPPDPEES